MSNPIILIIEPTLITVRYLIDASRALSYEPVVLCDRSHYTGDAAANLEKCTVYDINTRDLPAMLTLLASEKFDNLAGVITTADRYLPEACRLAAALGIPGPDQALLSVNDKAKVCALIPEYSPPFISFFLDKLPSQDLAAMARQYGAIIFKPAQSAGARGVFITEGFSEEVANEMLAIEANALGYSGNWVAQANIQGCLVSIEGFIRARRLVTLGFSMREKIGKAECINRFPATDEIPAPVRSKMVESVSQLAIRSGFRQGFFHSEFIIQKDNCFLIDANFGRLAGSGIGIQIGLAYGKQPVETYMQVIDQTLFSGQRSGGDFLSNEPIPTLALHYGVKAAAHVIDIILPEEMTELVHHRFMALNREVPPISKGSSAMIGVLIGDAKKVALAISKLRLVTPDGWLAPYFKEGH